MKQIPNFFTLLNLVFGCLAIVNILQTGQDIVYIEPAGYTTVDLPENIVLGAVFIFAAAVVDFLDGFIARLFKASSEMGKQLDSLADLVSFGVAPGMILYQMLRISFAKEAGGLDTSLLVLVPAFVLPCAAAWRPGIVGANAEMVTRMTALGRMWNRGSVETGIRTRRCRPAGGESMANPD